MTGRAGALALFAALTAASARGQVLVPLTDLVAPYLGVGEPGLYPGGTNAPAGDHLTLGLARAAGVVPRAADGSPDPAGWIGLVELGISNTNQEGARSSASRIASATTPAGSCWSTSPRAASTRR